MFDAPREYYNYYRATEKFVNVYFSRIYRREYKRNPEKKKNKNTTTFYAYAENPIRLKIQTY